jgi:hypothetical protein
VNGDVTMETAVCWIRESFIVVSRVLKREGKGRSGCMCVRRVVIKTVVLKD